MLVSIKIEDLKRGKLDLVYTLTMILVTR